VSTEFRVTAASRSMISSRIALWFDASLLQSRLRGHQLTFCRRHTFLMRFALGRFVFRFGEPGDTDKLGTQPGRATGAMGHPTYWVVVGGSNRRSATSRYPLLMMRYFVTGGAPLERSRITKIKRLVWSGRYRPGLSEALHQLNRATHITLTANCAAAAVRVAPASTAATIRLRRSSE